MVSVLGVTALVASLVYLRLTDGPVTWVRSAIETVPLACFAALSGLTGGPVLLTAALALSRQGDRAFLAGLTGFALAHLAYIALFLRAGAGLPPAGAAVAILVLALSTEVWLAPHTGALRWPVRGYTVLLSLMALTALGLRYALAQARWGAVLFLVSDLLLAIALFRPPFAAWRRAMLGRALWLAFEGGQAAILMAFALPSAGIRV